VKQFASGIVVVLSVSLMRYEVSRLIESGRAAAAVDER